MNASGSPWWLEHLPDIWPGYAELLEAEGEAAEVLCYHPTLLHGLLQTAETARSIIGTVAEPEWASRNTGGAVELRMERQRRLFARTDVSVSVYFDQSALYRRPGDPQAWRRQFANILRVAHLPNVSVGLVPFAAGVHPAICGTMTVLRGPKGDVLYLEGAHSDQVVWEDRTLIDLCLARFRVLKDVSLFGGDLVPLLHVLGGYVEEEA